MNIARSAIFVEVVKQGGFATAARELGVSAPAVSKQIALMERELGVVLLNRTTRRMVLTEEGRLYYEGASKALDDLRETEYAVNELKVTPTGRLKINAPMSFGREYLAQPLADFARAYPKVVLEVDFSDRWVDVIGEAYDLVVRIGHLEDSTLVARRMASCPIVLCASPNFIDRYPNIDHPDLLAETPAVIYHRHQAQESWSYAGVDGDGKVRLQKQLAANTAEMQLAACLAGIGVALLPIFSAYPHLCSGNLVHLFPTLSTTPERGIYLLYPPNRQASTRTRLMIDHLLGSAAQYAWHDYRAS